MHGTSSRSQFRSLTPRDSAAPVAGLSRAKREALLQCLLCGGYLERYPGGWRAPKGDVTIAIVTVKTLVERDGLLSVGSTGWATLTIRGFWYARTLNSQKIDDDGTSPARCSEAESR